MGKGTLLVRCQASIRDHFEISLAVRLSLYQTLAIYSFHYSAFMLIKVLMISLVGGNHLSPIFLSLFFPVPGGTKLLSLKYGRTKT